MYEEKCNLTGGAIYYWPSGFRILLPIKRYKYRGMGVIGGIW